MCSKVASCSSENDILLCKDLHPCYPQRKKLLERAVKRVPGTIIVGQVQFCPTPWQQRGHKNHVAILLPPCRQIHRTGLDRPFDDQGEPGTVQILLVAIALLISEHFPAGF